MMYKLRFAAIVPKEVIDKAVADHCKKNNLKVVDKQFCISIGGHLRCYTEEWVYLLVNN